MRTDLMRGLLVAGLLAVPLAACSDSDDSTQTPDTGVDTDAESDGSGTDTGEDIDAAEDADTALPDADTGEDVPDVAEEIDTADLVPCETQEGCPELTEFCKDGFCQQESCRSEVFWYDCENKLNAIEPDLGRHAICVDRICTLACLTDDDCATGEACADFGVCRPFTGEITGVQPTSGVTGLRVGLSNTLWNFPIGTSLGGYGERAAYDDGRYTKSLRASAGIHGDLWLRGMAVDSGDRQFLILRAPIIFMGAEMNEEVARSLQERTGHDWRDSILLSSTHTHSGPCRHWPLPEQAATTLGTFGIGEYSQEFYNWLRDSLIESAHAALDDLQPAKIGWEILEAYDMQDVVGRDRWAQTPPFDDNRALLMRVDDMDDNPRAFVFSFAAHGTDNGSDYATGDVLGGAETWLEWELGRRYGTFVQTMFINQNSGSMSPAGGVQGHGFPQSTERLGWAFTQRVVEEFVALETQPSMSIQAHMHRFPITYDRLGYARGEFAGNFQRPAGGEYTYGGLSCAGPFGGDRDFSTAQNVSELTCAGALQFLLFNRPPTTMSNAQIQAGVFEQDGRRLNWLTMPGELSMELSWEALRALRDEFDLDPLDSWTFGYANGHLLYLMPSNLRGERPPFPGMSTPHPDDTSVDQNGFPNRPGAPDDYPAQAFSWLQGGYESTMSPWGPRTGDYVVQQAVNAWRRLLDPNATVDSPRILPTMWTPRVFEPFPIDPSDPARLGEITMQPPSSLARFDTIEVAWIGGDTGAEMPQAPRVVLQRDVDAVWTDVELSSTRPYTNHEPVFLTRFRRAGAEYEWIVRWEELGDFPAGTYRFAITGHALIGGTRTPYSTTTNSFAVTPSSALVLAATAADASTWNVEVAYPAAENMRFLELNADRGAVTGNFRMRDPMTPPGTPSAVPVGWLTAADDLEDEVTPAISAQAIATGGNIDIDVTYTIASSAQSRGGRNNVPVTTLTVNPNATLPTGTTAIRFTATDTFGNTGTVDLTL